MNPWVGDVTRSCKVSTITKDTEEVTVKVRVTDLRPSTEEVLYASRNGLTLVDLLDRF